MKELYGTSVELELLQPVQENHTEVPPLEENGKHGILILYLSLFDSVTPSRNRAQRYLVRFFCFSMRRFAVTRGSVAVSLMWLALTCVDFYALLCRLEICKLWEVYWKHASKLRWENTHQHVWPLGSFEATLLLDLGPIELCDPSSHRLGLFSSIQFLSASLETTAIFDDILTVARKYVSDRGHALYIEKGSPWCSMTTVVPKVSGNLQSDNIKGY